MLWVRALFFIIIFSGKYCKVCTDQWAGFHLTLVLSLPLCLPCSCFVSLPLSPFSISLSPSNILLDRSFAISSDETTYTLRVPCTFLIAQVSVCVSVFPLFRLCWFHLSNIAHFKLIVFHFGRLDFGPFCCLVRYTWLAVPISIVCFFFILLFRCLLRYDSIRINDTQPQQQPTTTKTSIFYGYCNNSALKIGMGLVVSVLFIRFFPHFSIG